MAAASKKRVKKRKRKSVKKSASRKGKVTKVIHESTREVKVDKVLVDNFVALQKIMVHLSSKFDNLSTQISKLLDLFDISAKALAKKDFESARELEGTEEIMKRLDDISRQAGLIGRGLELIHRVNQERGGKERMTREEEEQPEMQHSIMHPRMQRPMPHVQQPMPEQRPMQPQAQRPAPAQRPTSQPIQHTNTRPPLAPPRTPPRPQTPNRPQNNQNQVQAP